MIGAALAAAAAAGGTDLFVRLPFLPFFNHQRAARGLGPLADEKGPEKKRGGQEQGRAKNEHGVGAAQRAGLAQGINAALFFRVNFAGGGVKWLVAATERDQAKIASIGTPKPSRVT